MRGDKEVIRALNKVLGQSLIAINQYFLHARIARHWGLEALNENFYKYVLDCFLIYYLRKF